MNRLLYDQNEAARLLDTSRNSLSLLIKRGAIRTVLLGNRRKIAQSELERFIRTGGAAQIWPAKRDGKTTNQVEVIKKPLITSADADRAGYQKRESA